MDAEPPAPQGPREPLSPDRAPRSRARLFAFERNAVVRAGAGTGKTEALSTVYLHLVSGLTATPTWPRAGVGPERIVALTFTEKAAREMRERIAEAVALLANERLPKELESPDPRERADAARRWGATRGASAAVVARVLALAESAAAQGRPLPPPELWQRIAWSLGNAHIGTFHGFASGVLRRAAVHLGIDPAFAVLEDEDAEILLRQSVLAAVADLAQRDVTAVVELMGAAGGLGERNERGLVSVLTALVRRLDEDGRRAEDVGAVSAVDPAHFDPHVAVRRLEELAAACDTVPSLREDGSAERVRAVAAAVAALPSWQSPDDALARMRALRTLGALPPRNRTRRIEPLAEDAREAVTALSQDAVSVVSKHLAEAARGVVAAAQRGYERAKRQRAALDFADLMRLLRDALRDHAPLRREWKRRYDAVLIDEFQDTNRVQRDLLFLLRERRDAERLLAPGQSLRASELEPTGLLVVGDAKQSIYAFRGAEVSVFLDTERELAEAGGERLELTDSFRALDEVLSAVNPATEALLSSARLQGLYDRGRDALAAVTRGDGGARAELLLVPGGSADAQRRAEGEAIARRILGLATPHSDVPGWRAPRMDEVAILVPSWSHLEPIKRALQARGIPYALRGGPGFWERREVDDLVTLLRWVADPSDRLALAALLRGPLVSVSDAGLATLLARDATLDDVLDPSASLRATLAGEDVRRLDESRGTLKRLARFGPMLGPHGALRQCLVERGFAAVLAALPFGAQRVANVDKLLGIAAAAEERGGDEADLHGFVRYVDRMRAAAQRESEADLDEAATGSVQVMSIHAAKGLEWPVVFVAQTARRPPARTERVLLDAAGDFVVLPGGADPSLSFRARRRDAHAAEDDDARRLLYVALTRARDLLVVSGPEEGGEGEWPRLREALRREAPFSVRVIPPEGAVQGVAVRVRVEAGDEAPDELPEAPAPAPPARRRLTLSAPAAQDFAWCPRRFHALHDLGLREHHRADVPSEAAFGVLREALAHTPLDELFSRPDEAIAAVCGAMGMRGSSADAEGARGLARRLARTALARRLRADPALLMGMSVPFASSVDLDDGALTLTGRVDAVLRGEALGVPGLVVLALSPGDREGAEPGGGVARVDASLSLLLARRAFAARLDAATSGEAAVHAAVLRCTDDAVHEPALVRVDERGLSDRVAELVRQLAAARREGRWDARPRHACDALRCGFTARCHG
ncbi:MAG: UvrD-helicase domain-containing protein [Polyangiales bacterium]